MKLILIKMQNRFQLFHHVENDGAAVIVHHGREHTVAETREVQGGKFAAALKTVFVYGATVPGEEVTGDGVEEHHTIAALFDIGFIERGATQLQVCREIIRLSFIDVHHQAFAAIAAAGAVDRRGDGSIQEVDLGVYFGRIVRLQERAKTIVLGLLVEGDVCDGAEAGIKRCIQGSKVLAANGFAE